LFYYEVIFDDIKGQMDMWNFCLFNL